MYYRTGRPFLFSSVTISLAIVSNWTSIIPHQRCLTPYSDLTGGADSKTLLAVAESALSLLSPAAWRNLSQRAGTQFKHPHFM